MLPTRVDLDGGGLGADADQRWRDCSFVDAVADTDAVIDGVGRWRTLIGPHSGDEHAVEDEDESILLSEGCVRRAEVAVEVEGVGRTSIGPILMQFVPSCRRWGQICKLPCGQRRRRRGVPLSEGRMPVAPFPDRRT